MDGPAACVSVSLPVDHWVGEALLRLHALGALDPYVPVRRGVPLCVARAALAAAAVGDDERAEEGAAALARGWLARLEEEFPGPDGDPDLRLAGSSLAGGYEERSNVAAPGGGGLFPPDRFGAQSLDDVSRAWAGAEAVLAITEHGGLVVGGRITPGGAEITALDAVLGTGPVTISVGRASSGYGTTVSGGVVFDEAVFDRIQIETPVALRLPGVLAPLGRASLSTFFTRMDEERHPEDPFFWGATFSLQPHRRATFSVHRAAFFGGLSEEPINTRSILNLLIGRVAGVGFEDQVVSVEGRFHLPTERLLPLTVYMEWGAEDAAGGWWDVPARVAGIYIPAFPGITGLAAGLERSGFQRTCCDNPMWYRHWGFPGGWTADDHTLGHPMGGHGVEWLAYANAVGNEAGLALEGRVFRRERRSDNLFVPGREGVSWGGTSRVSWRTPLHAEIFADLSLERGDGWNERQLEVGGRYFLR